MCLAERMVTRRTPLKVLTAAVVDNGGYSTLKVSTQLFNNWELLRAGTHMP